MNLILRFFIFLLICIPGTLEAAKVSRITGYSDKAAGNSSEKSGAEEGIKTEEQIEKALKMVQKKDISTYNSLIKIRTSNFDKFLSDLQQWVDDNNSSKANREKKRLNNLLRKLDSELELLSQSFSKETDEIKKTDFQNQIRSKVSERIKAELDQDRLFIRLKKMALNYEETKLMQKVQHREMIEKELLLFYMPEAKGDVVS